MADSSQMNIKTLFELTRCAVDELYPLPDLSGVDWEELYTFSNQQAITGVMFDLVQRLGGKEAGVPRQVLLKWFVQSDIIHKLNDTLNRYSVQTIHFLEQEGFRCLLLKGQGNALMYPNPFARLAGDIDLLVVPQHLSALPKNLEERRNVILSFVRRKFPKSPLRYYHVDFPIYKDIPIELHFEPCLMNNPLYNHRLQQWLGERTDEQFLHKVDLPEGAGCIPTPTLEYNIVFQMAHMMHHFFDEGIGLRQMMDYYYLLKSASKEKFGICNEDLELTLRNLNLYHFACAVMYVMREAFGMPDEWMIVPIDERRGKCLMEEILHGGNFGKYSGLTEHGTAAKYFLKHWRNMHFFVQYPVEALSEPLFRTWHFFWRFKNRM